MNPSNQLDLDDEIRNENEDEEEDLLRRTPPDVPNPRWTWIVAGGGLFVLGVILSLSMVMLAIGLLMCAIGAGMAVAAFLSNEGRKLRIVSNQHERMLSWVPQEREPVQEEESENTESAHKMRDKTKEAA